MNFPMIRHAVKRHEALSSPGSALVNDMERCTMPRNDCEGNFDHMVFGAIETGGSKVICAVGTGPDDIRDRLRVLTTTPSDTLDEVVDFLLRHHRETPLSAIGVGSFGPLDLRLGSPTYGHIAATPKPGWQYADLLGPLSGALNLPIALETDVNAAALGEHRWGAGVGLDSLVYITVGTGIGGGAVVAGRPVHGASHPEMGHARIPHDWAIDSFEGFCPYHGDCLEGLAAGPAIRLRWGRPAESLPNDHPAWDLEAGYLAAGIANIVLILTPERIVMGGGVMKQRHLFPLIRERVSELLQGYGITENIANAMNDYITPPALGDDSGIAGAFALAEMALSSAGKAP